LIQGCCSYHSHETTAINRLTQPKGFIATSRYLLPICAQRVNWAALCRHGYICKGSRRNMLVTAGCSKMRYTGVAVLLFRSKQIIFPTKFFDLL
jgi:hypothetical protein